MSSFQKRENKNHVAALDRNEDRIQVLSVGSLYYGSLVHDALLERADFRLSIATDYPELRVIPKQEVIHVAILHNSLSLFGLNAASGIIRRRWPLARILVLRYGKGFLENSLFDLCMEPNIDPTILLTVIEQLQGDERDRRSGDVER